MADIKSCSRHLGLRPNASEAVLRATYKTLALQHHPDKAEAHDRLKATANFQKLQSAYEQCLSYIKLRATAKEASDSEEQDARECSGSKYWDNEGFFADEEDEADDNSDWRGRLPAGYGSTKDPWWDRLTGEEPAVVRRWARVCAKADRNAKYTNSMTRTERAILNMEYRAAYERFEYWRRKYIERFDEEDRIQANINQMPERQHRWVQLAFEKKRSAPGYTYDVYREDLDEEACHLYEDEDATVLAELGKKTWRRGWNSVRKRQTPTQRLEAFERQVAAAELRGPLPEHDAHDRARRIQNRQITRDKLEREVREEAEMAQLAIEQKKEQEKRDEEERFLAGIIEAMQNHVRLEDVPGVHNPVLLADTKLDYTAGYLRQGMERREPTGSVRPGG